jgi:hypothetical protein
MSERGEGAQAAGMQIPVVMKPPKFDGSATWTAFYRQFEAVAEHNGWSSREKVMHLLAILQ